MALRHSTLLALLLLLPLAAPARADEQKPKADPRLQGLKWRCIGPARGGRVSSVCGVRGDRRTYYMGACGGGVWKTTDAGASWKNISDKFFKTGSVGAVAVAASDPNVIYAGMGEPDPRGNFSHGDGVYRSTDAGKTWKHVGLADTRQIGRIAIDPHDPERVYVAALGHVYGPNAERGVFRSTDGGASWQRVHHVDDKTGAVDLAIDPHNPRVLYAGFWQVRRKPWRFDSGGEGSGLWRSKDGGDTWEELTKGLPMGMKGKIGVSASAAQRDLVYAVVEAEKGGVFRSTDGGDSWRRVNDERKLRQRAWYYSRIHADPQDADTVYVLNVRFQKSVDGGKSFQSIRVPHVDNHGLWIDPDDNQRMVESNDGGAIVSFDGGQTWSRQDNQPTAQFYRVAVDNRFPYRVLGAQQDNSTVSIPHTSSARNNRDFHPVGGGESGYIAARPDDPDIVYAGSYAGWLTRYDHRTRLSRPISPWPENPIGGGAGVLRHRFQWTFPIVISPHDPEVLYVGGECLFRSRDGGESWAVLSPDLTTNDKEKLKSSGGPITQDNTTVEYHCTIFSIAESPRKSGRIWVGTDDGRVHVTDDAGKGWKDVTPKGLKSDALISLVEASPHDADTAWLAVNRYKSDDFAPYLYRTRDRGETWDLMVEGLPSDAFVRSVREDPVRKDLLYVGTETGVWFSLDGGGAWQSLQLELPVVPITDVVTKDDDLVVATQGRSFWILGGLSRLRKWGRGSPVGVSLMAPEPANRGLPGSARIHFHLPEPLEEEARLAFLDDGGRVIREFEIEIRAEGQEETGEDDEEDSEKKSEAEDEEKGGKKKPGKKRPKRDRIKAQPGMNLHAWDMRREKPTTVPGAVGWPSVRSGPRVLPGTYTVRLTVGEEAAERPLVILRDPRLGMTDEQLAAAAAFADDVYGTLDRVHTAVNTIRDVRAQVAATKKRARKAGLAQAIREPASAITKALKDIEDALIQSKSKSPQDPLNYPVRLNDKLAMLMNLGNRDPRPTQGQRDVLASLKKRVEAQLTALDEVLETRVPAFNAAVAEANVPAVVLGKDEEEK